MHKPISKHPLVTALAADYARQIINLEEENEAQIENLYREFRRKYQWLKQTIEAQEDNDADSLDSSSAVSPTASLKQRT